MLFGLIGLGRVNLVIKNLIQSRITDLWSLTVEYAPYLSVKLTDKVHKPFLKTGTLEIFHCSGSQILLLRSFYICAFGLRTK